MSSITYPKRTFFSHGKRYYLPWGFHIVEGLAPFVELKRRLLRSDLSLEARKRFKWMDCYHHHGNVAQTCRYFGISRQTFYEWRRRYDRHNLSSLEDQDKTPKRKRQRTITPLQEQRIVALRKQYIRYGKEKLALIYTQYYGETMTA